jgi:hypothetical protein
VSVCAFDCMMIIFDLFYIFDFMCVCCEFFRLSVVIAEIKF